MNQIYNTRDPEDLWPNLGIFKRVLLVCVTPLNNEIFYCLKGASILQSRARSASLRDYCCIKTGN